MVVNQCRGENKYVVGHEPQRKLVGAIDKIQLLQLHMGVGNLHFAPSLSGR